MKITKEQLFCNYVLLIFMLVLLVDFMTLRSGALLNIIISSYVVLLAFSNISSNRSVPWVNPVSMFLLGYFLLNLSLPILSLMEGLYFKVPLVSRVSEASVLTSYYVSTLGMISFFWGARYNTRQTKHAQVNYTNLDDKKVAHTAIYYLSVLLLFSLIINYMLLGSGYFFGSYTGVYARAGIAGHVFYITQVLGALYSSLIAYYFYSYRVHRLTLIAIVFSAIPLLLLMTLYVFSGDRGELVYVAAPLVMVMYVFFRYMQKVTLFKLSVFIGLSLILVGLLREMRQLEEINVTAIVGFVVTQNFVDLIGIALTNIGASGLLAPAAIDMTNELGYQYGRLNLNALLGFIPGLRGFLNWTVGYGDGVYLEGASLLTESYHGRNATSGLGTSSIAEFYLDFGLLGVLLGHFLLGYLAKTICIKFISQRNAITGVIFMISIGVFATMARYSPLSMMIRYLIMPTILLIVVYVLIKGIRLKNATDRNS